MKKLFTLFILAIFSSQMWAGMVSGNFYCNKETKTTVTSSCGGGTITAKYGTTSGNYNNSMFSDRAYYTGYSLYDGRYVQVTATAAAGYTFKEWQVSGGLSSFSSSGNVMTFTVPMGSYYVHAIFTASSGGSGSGSGSGSRSSVVAATTSAKSVTVYATGSGSGKTVNYALPDGVVDMGTAGYWRTKNVGGTNEISAGDYYQWGSTTKNTYASSYTLPTSADLISTNDAATTALGAGYCIPTKAEWDRLISSCSWSRSAYNTYIVTNTTTGNTIEIPNNTGSKQGSSSTYSTALGWYWTSSYNSGNPYICALWNTKDTKETVGITNFNSAKIYYSCYIRPIYNMTGTLYTLTVNVVNGGTTYTYKYKGASGQVVNVSVGYAAGYTAAWNDAVSAASARSFTLTSDITKTVTYTSSTVTATFNNYDGTQLAQYTNVVSGTTPTYSGATPTKPEDNYNTYEFSGWNTAADGSGNALGDITANTTYYAQFNTTPRTYSVTFLNSAEDQNPTVKNDYHYGDAITNRPVIDPQRIGDEEHNYTFVGWQLGETVYTNNQVDAMTVSGNMVFTASFDEEIIPILPNTSKITIGSFAANGKVLIISQGNTVELSSEGGYVRLNNGTSVSIQAVANDYYHFSGWAEDMDEEAIIDIRSLNGDVTYTPTFALNTALTLVDNEDEAYYTDLYNTHDGEVLTVTMQDRQLTEGTWITFCLPFDYTIPVGHPFSGAVYQLYDATMSGTNTSAYISMDFHRTYEMKANVPYLIVPTMTTATNLVFDGVTIDEAPQQKMVEAISGSMQFVSQPWQATITNTADKPNFYLASANKLRYVKTTGTTFKAFRAYFHRLIDLGAPVRRMVINLDGVETTKEISDEGEVVDITSKRMENGVLYIERNGVRYDAQGQRVE